MNGSRFATMLFLVATVVASPSAAQVGLVHTLTSRVPFNRLVEEAARGRISAEVCRSFDRVGDQNGCAARTVGVGDRTFFIVEICSDPDELGSAAQPINNCREGRPRVVIRKNTRQIVALPNLDDVEPGSELFLMTGQSGVYVYHYGDAQPQWLARCRQARFEDGGRAVSCLDSFGDRISLDLTGRVRSRRSEASRLSPEVVEVRRSGTRVERARALALGREHRFVRGVECLRLVRPAGRPTWCGFDLLPSGALVRISLCFSRLNELENARCHADSTTRYLYLSVSTGETFDAPGGTDSSSDGSLLFWSDHRGTHAFEVVTRTSTFLAPCWNAVFVAQSSAVYCVTDGLELLRISMRRPFELPVIVSDMPRPTMVRFALDSGARTAALQFEINASFVVFSQTIRIYDADDGCFGEWRSGGAGETPCMWSKYHRFSAQVSLDQFRLLN